MVETTKLKLPKISDNMTADVVRDINGLADAVDAKAGVVGGLATLGADGKVPAGQLAVDMSGLATKEELSAHSGKGASLSGAGHVQLSSETNSTSENLAATPKAVKAAYDRADAAFTQANDGKTAVANAVTAKGVSASPSDTFSTLATKIGQINTGKKWAGGKLNLRSSDLTEMYFNTLSDASAVFRRLEVGSIPFRPSRIIITVAGGRFHTVVDTEAEKRLDIPLISVSGTAVRLNGNAMVEDRGFKLPIQFDGTGVNTIDWIAFE